MFQTLKAHSFRVLEFVAQWSWVGTMVTPISWMHPLAAQFCWPNLKWIMDDLSENMQLPSDPRSPAPQPCLPQQCFLTRGEFVARGSGGTPWTIPRPRARRCWSPPVALGGAKGVDRWRRAVLTTVAPETAWYMVRGSWNRRPLKHVEPWLNKSHSTSE